MNKSNRILKLNEMLNEMTPGEFSDTAFKDKATKYLDSVDDPITNILSLVNSIKEITYDLSKDIDPSAKKILNAQNKILFKAFRTFETQVTKSYVAFSKMLD